jgi:UDP-N-acetylmuramoyl-L-alanyl-D-glutamate--2,6-diaminopimelate ligase
METNVIKEKSRRTVPLGELISAALDSTSAEWSAMKISGISIDSRKTRPGDLFIAVPGLAMDGHQFIAQAAAAGACAAVVEHITPDPILQVKVNNTRRSIAEISHRYYGNPAQRMKLFGVTGTNGKTTVVAAVESIAHAAGCSIGVIGTVGHWAGDEEIPAANTTPEALDSDILFSRMLAAGITDCVMEVSSHALALDRVLGLPFIGAVFTNLTRDHLDFHADLDEYRLTKLRLFREYLQPGGWAIINIDDPAGMSFVEASTQATLWKYSLSDREADIRWKVLDEGLGGSTAAVFTPVGLLNIKTPLWGSFNFANLAAAVGIAIALGYPPEAIIQGLHDFTGVRGRVQPVRGDFDFDVFVDYAHTPDALHKVLAAARPLVRGRLRVLFGCGGNRDKGKRPLMARAVEEFASDIYLTSDNPRSEDPVKIIADVLEGFSDPDAVIVEPDRAKAIERILLDCQPTDAAFLCGKGHENYQIIGEDIVEFDDRSFAEKTLVQRGFSIFSADIPARR